MKNCPYCGKDELRTLIANSEKRVQCINEKCANAYKQPMNIEDWEHRPLEDAFVAAIQQQKMRIERLRRAIKEINQTLNEYKINKDNDHDGNCPWLWEDNGLDILVKIETIIKEALEVNDDN